ncbi:hypothetical protein AB0950_40165, partial [Streptomyces sp. NPDC007189]|uniref:hypothetical protein n=1 Tax=Streptomyces sp. NPDC007189 TaxID=3154315 RepID=UPI0034550CCC
AAPGPAGLPEEGVGAEAALGWFGERWAHLQNLYEPETCHPLIQSTAALSSQGSTALTSGPSQLNHSH